MKMKICGSNCFGQLGLGDTKERDGLNKVVHPQISHSHSNLPLNMDPSI